DHLLVGGDEGKVAWIDMDLSTRPYRVLRSHGGMDVRSVAFHPTYPLFASAAEDGSAFAFHGMVFADLLQNPLIVPLKILRAPPPPQQATSSSSSSKSLYACAFHPSQPWLFTAGADCSVTLFTH
ncbi:unnamed protein product, partial [Closterium sp. Naga37s-1]